MWEAGNNVFSFFLLPTMEKFYNGWGFASVIYINMKVFQVRFITTLINLLVRPWCFLMGILIMPHDQKVIIIVIIYRLVMLLPQTPFFIIQNLIDSTHSISHFYLQWVIKVKRYWCAHERGKEFLMHVMDMSQNEIDTFFVYIRYFTSFCISLPIPHRIYNFDLGYFLLVFP